MDQARLYVKIKFIFDNLIMKIGHQSKYHVLLFIFIDHALGDDVITGVEIEVSI